MRLAVNGKIVRWIQLSLVVAIAVLGYIGQSIFIGACALCGFLFWLIQQYVLGGINKEDHTQRKHCRINGFLLLLPATGVILTGVSILFQYLGDIAPIPAYGVIALAAVCVAVIMLQIIWAWKDNSLPARFLRYTLVSSISVPFSLIVVLLLYVTKSDNAVTLSAMSTIIFGSIALLIALSMILVSFCGYKSTRDSIKSIQKRIKENKLHFTRASIVKDAFFVIGKTALSIISVSFFMFVNALYSGGMGVARYIAVKMHRQDRAKQIKSYRNVGIIISFASICYVLYSVRLLFGGTTGKYSMHIALIIALYTFVELGLNIRDSFRLRKSKALEAKALQAISFSSMLLGFVLTQTAIMSFAAPGDNSFANALSGIVFGGLSVILGLYIIVESFYHKKTNHEQGESQ